MAKKDRLTEVSVRIGKALGRADKQAHLHAKKLSAASKVTKEELQEISKQVDALMTWDPAGAMCLTLDTCKVVYRTAFDRQPAELNLVEQCTVVVAHCAVGARRALEERCRLVICAARHEQLAYVQTPHAFYNFDNFQSRYSPRRNTYWDEGQLFYDVIQPGRV